MSIRVVRLGFSLPPLQRWITPTRCYIADILQPVLIDNDNVDRLAIAVHELLENCIKYTNGDHVRLEFEINRDGDEAIASARLSSRATRGISSYSKGDCFVAALLAINLSYSK